MFCSGCFSDSPERCWYIDVLISLQNLTSKVENNLMNASCRVEGGLVSILSGHWARGRGHLGQVISPSQGQKTMHTHAHI